MIEVKQVVIRISRPSGTDPGRVESAWYRVIKDMVTLTDREGVPLSKEAPSARRATRVEARWEAPLPPDSDDDAPRRIAGRILQAKWRASHGSDFRTRQLHYPRGMSAMMDDEPQDDVDWLVRALVNAERLLAGHWADPASLSPPEITMLCKIEDLLDQLEEKTNYELTGARPELPKCGGEDSR